jgi:hypothetical protein
MRNPQPAGGAPPPPVPDPPPPIPVPPPARFSVKGKMIVVLNKASGQQNSPLRPGKWGHYLVPYVVDSANNTAKPFNESSADNNPEIEPQDGFPGKSKDSSDKQPTPDKKKCMQGRDFMIADPDVFWEVGIGQVQAILEQAEALDLAFARRMEGLGSVSRSVVWDCIDPDYDASDREQVMSQFMSKYLERFYTRMDTGNNPRIEDMSAEALHKHKVFCKAWTEKHYRTLTPSVTSTAETLAAEFYPHLEGYMQPQQYKLSRMELARLLMRHPEFATEFANALHFFNASMEQSRGGRNANYKQINMTAAARVTSYKRLGNLLEEKGALLAEILQTLCQESSFYLDPWTVDWYNILGQMPTVHRYFDDPGQYQGSSSRMRNELDNQLPPWLYGRDRS